MHASKRKAVLFTILGGLIALVFWNSTYQKAVSAGASANTTVRQSQAVAASSGTAQETVSPRLGLPERQALGEPAGALFTSRPTVSPPSKTNAAAPVALSVPPVPYRFAGKLVREGTPQIFLAKGNVAIPISEEKVLDDTYRVEAIGEDYVTLVYLPLNQKQNIALRYASPTSPTSRPPTAVASTDRIASDLARWKQLSESEQRKIRRYMREMPASRERDRLYEEYKRQVFSMTK